MESSDTLLIFLLSSVLATLGYAEDILGCGGFVQSKVPINFERVEVKLYTKQGALKFKTESAPNNGYFLVAVYDKGDYVLKLDPPNGWSFEPMEIDLHIDGKTDPCAKGEDINFRFSGFSVTGIIGSIGRSQGPAGVELELRNQADNAAITKNYTVDGGMFIFSKIMPGKYTVKASHTSWTFSQDEATAVVKDDNTFIDKAIVVSGYDVKGHVLSAGEAIQGVTFILLSKDPITKDLSGCEKVTQETLEKLGKKAEEISLCATISGKDGVFTFPSVPSGEYSLIPYYSSRNIVFDVVPTKVTFVVNYRSVVIKTPFQVHGFSVTGRVVDSQGKGIEDASVEVQGEGKSAVTIADGTYVLENVTSGIYKLVVNKENIFFDVFQVHISPNTPQLPDIKAKRYGICGQVIITQMPQGVHPISQRKVMLLPEGSQNTEMITANTDDQGQFCLQAPPGDFKLEALISPNEAKLGLKLQPSHMNLQITHFPLIGIKFTQLFTTISGSIECIGDCEDTIVTLVSSERNFQAKTLATIEKTENGLKFVFDDVLPGKYKVTPVKHRWCWQPRNAEVEAVDGDVTDIKFSHVGYILKCVLSHNITLNFTVEGEKEASGSFDVSKGTNKFCLKVPGVYHLTPQSCYKFEKDSYIYDSTNPSVLTLSTTTYKLKVRITVQRAVSDLAMSVKTVGKNAEETLPLTLISNPVANEKVSKKQNNSEDTSAKGGDVDSTYVYELLSWARLGETLTLTPTSKEVLFYPESHQVIVKDDCPGAEATFEGRNGIFIRGSVSPALVDVVVTIQTFATGQHKEAKTISVMTDANGEFSVGPMHSDVEYSVSASKKGYVISEKKDQKGHFVAMKLGEIFIKVDEEDGKPMQGVLLSLSGGKFRSNNLTPVDGTFKFTDLSPGNYFLRPMLKEYSFSPNTQMIDVTEGASLSITIKGQRVAFSCNGFVTTLSGESVKDVVLEALGEGECKELQEETVTDSTGSYRLRGLEPQCTYIIRVRIGTANPDIQRAGPANRAVKVSGADVENMNFIIFYKPESYEVTASINTEAEYLSSLKLFIYKDDNLMSPIHTISLGAHKFVHFPKLPIADELYTVKLESTLSKKLYDFEESSVTFSTKDGYSSHLEFTFKAERKRIEPEPTQSVIALPFAVALVLLAYNYEIVIQFLGQMNSTLKGLNSTSGDHVDSSDEGSKSKKKKR